MTCRDREVAQLIINRGLLIKAGTYDFRKDKTINAKVNKLEFR